MSNDTHGRKLTTFDVFISYARADRDPVERLVHGLKRDGIQVWFDMEQMSGGHTTMSARAGGSARSARMIGCLSDAVAQAPPRPPAHPQPFRRAADLSQ